MSPFKGAVPPVSQTHSSRSSADSPAPSQAKSKLISNWYQLHQSGLQSAYTVTGVPFWLPLASLSDESRAVTTLPRVETDTSSSPAASSSSFLSRFFFDHFQKQKHNQRLALPSHLHHVSVCVYAPPVPEREQQRRSTLPGKRVCVCVCACLRACVRVWGGDPPVYDARAVSTRVTVCRVLSRSVREPVRREQERTGL